MTMQNNFQPVKILEVNEPWAECKLIDGTIIKIKIVFVTVSLVVNEKGEGIVDANGSFQYGVESQNIMVIKPNQISGMKQ